MSTSDHDAAPIAVTPEAVAARLAAGDEIFLIDVREPRPFHSQHIPGAILLPAGDFADRFGRELDPEDDVVLVCERGHTSEAAARFLIAQGFRHVASMTGGMLAWTGPLEGRDAA
jgi:adenylyltransferase/sulfurtransferase